MYLHKKLNLGCGADLREGWVNHDVVPLSGVDIVHDLTDFPWPFPDAAFTEIVLINVLEHLPDCIATMEELFRIAAPGCRIVIRVPFWNSPDAISDPTHRKLFNEQSFDFFVPGSRHHERRPYYSHARFAIVRRHFWVRGFGRYARIDNGALQSLLVAFARFLGGVIWVEEFELRAIKNYES